MSAAERLKPSRRDARRNALVEVFASFASRLAAILDEHDLTEDVENDAPRARRKPLRVPYVPTHGQPIDPAVAARARADARRRGL